MHKIFQNISPFLIGSNLTDKWTPTEKPWGRGCVISYVIAELLPKKHSKKGRIQLDGWHLPFITSLPGKCFRLVSELRKTEERDFSVLAARKMEPEPKWAVFKSPGYVCKRFFPFFPSRLTRATFSRGLWLSLVVRLLRNNTETLATQARSQQQGKRIKH